MSAANSSNSPAGGRGARVARPSDAVAEGAGERLSPLELPQDYWILLALPRLARKTSTADIYRRFVELIDERRSQVDVVPLRLVADCLLVGRRHSVEAVPA